MAKARPKGGVGDMRLGAVTAAMLAALAMSTPSWAQSTLDTLPFDMKLQLAEAGDDEAQRAVGAAYEMGLEGVDIDPAEAADWYRQSADQGNVEAQYRLARLVH